MSHNTESYPFDPNLVKSFARGEPGVKNAINGLKKLRLDKIDKPSVVIISAQKAGSTLLCYICALINTRDSIKKFRNDFDVLPMLSFPQHLIPQNFNARQDGAYQMYKINGTLREMDQVLTSVKALDKVIWSCREFTGYYKSVYWWITEFYPRIGFENLSLVSWDQFQDITFIAMAEDHIEELRFVYDNLINMKSGALFPLIYEDTIAQKLETIRDIADWLDIDITDNQAMSIGQKTSKEAMAAEDRFDPVAYGEGGGLSKINLHRHQYEVNEENRNLYQSMFEDRFRDVGIVSYSDYANS